MVLETLLNWLEEHRAEGWRHRLEGGGLHSDHQGGRKITALGLDEDMNLALGDFDHIGFHIYDDGELVARLAFTHYPYRAPEIARAFFAQVYPEGRFTECNACEGEGTLECFADRWSYQAGHYTDHWIEDCDRCEGSGQKHIIPAVPFKFTLAGQTEAHRH